MDRKKPTLADAGMDETAVDAAWRTIEDAAEAHQFGGAVALIRRHGSTVFHKSTGWAVREPEDQRTPMADDTIFDVASLTKVVATTPSILKLVANDKVGLDEPIGAYIPEFGTEGTKAEVTIRRVMSHSAGLVAWRGVFTEATGIDAYIANFAKDQPEHEPGKAVIYSDPGFIMLGEVVKRVSGRTVADFARLHVFDMLRMGATGFLPPAHLHDQIAATEVGNAHETKMANETPVGGPWRDYLLRGEVHDGNAWYGLNGVAGHAGLFSTAPDLAKYGQMWLNGGVLDGARILPQAIVDEATREQTGLGAPNDRRGLGWQMVPHPDNPEPGNHSGRGLSQRAFGHTGFTGTSLWMDPERDLIIILLTNRVHPKVDAAYLPTRAAFTAAIARACS